MKIPYIKIPITDMYAYLAPYPAQTKGQIFEAVLHYGMYQNWPALDLPPNQTQSYCIVQQMIEREVQSYKKFCKEQKQKAKKLWDEKQNTVEAVAMPGRQCQSKQETKQKQEAKQELENINTLTAQAQPAQGASVLSQKKKERQKTLLQQFSNAVLENFESAVQTNEQKHIWFKRNCRCLRDILNFCNQDIPLALQTIDVCIRRLEKAGLTGGYEAVCRNLPEYMVRAQQELEEQARG